MSARAFDYATVRVVPRVEREEFVNAGVVLYCPTADFLACRVSVPRDRVTALCPTADVAAIMRHVEAFRAVCAGEPGGGPIAKLPLRERFHWLVHPRSAVVQVSPVHGGRSRDLQGDLDRLFALHVA